MTCLSGLLALLDVLHLSTLLCCFAAKGHASMEARAEHVHKMGLTLCWLCRGSDSGGAREMKPGTALLVQLVQLSWRPPLYAHQGWCSMHGSSFLLSMACACSKSTTRL